MVYHSYLTAVGRCAIFEIDGKIVAIDFQSKPHDPIYKFAADKETPLIKTAAKQLDEYMAGKRRKFDIPLAPTGTEFQTAVWDALLKIPFGESKSYHDVAVAIGRKKAVRAVGNAVGKNPIPIIIPCHRVIASDGGLGGFSLGLPMKRKLLALENIRIWNDRRELKSLKTGKICA
ncbi:MAG: methylated-DNA--[protein]-cysteine S-methyltransferase [Proteobacteria bacterium]|nr:methylated-DNA--[protein]-cysteine S-methyltransferase [Pseudomonadota bacterium]